MYIVKYQMIQGSDSNMLSHIVFEHFLTDSY